MKQKVHSSPAACAALALICGVLLAPIVLAVLAYRQQRQIIENDERL